MTAIVTNIFCALVKYIEAFTLQGEPLWFRIMLLVFAFCFAGFAYFSAYRRDKGFEELKEKVTKLEEGKQ